MPAVAEVQFKATGSSEVEGAFKSVGSAAGDTTTKIQQNSSAMKSVGQGMKSATSGIAQTATAFATLALSVVSTWRAYRDLGDAQLGVDRANFKVQKSTQAVANAQKLVAGLKAGMRKTDLETIAASSKIAARQEALNKKVHQNKITTKAARAEQDAINLSRSKVGSDKASELAKAEQDLKNKTEALGLATESAAQKQKHFNDSTQDFYLSLLPTAISTIATAVSGFESIKNVLGGGGGGLIGSLSGIGLVLGAGSLALLAYKNNWLGFRDAVGGAIDWVKERFGVWKDTIAAVFNLIKSGDWGGAFNKIREAAYKFWLDLKKQVPLLTAVDTIVNAIKNGNWKYAFSTIVAAADVMWLELKKKVPFLADVEKFILDIAGGNWKAIPEAIQGAFNATLGKGIELVFGKNWKLGLEAWLLLQEMEAKTKKRSLILQYAIAINASITAITGIDLLKWFKEHPLTVTEVPIIFGGISMAVEDPKFRGAMAAGSLIIINALGEALKRVANLLDPYLAQVFAALNFNTAIISVKDALLTAGKGIWTAIFNGIKGAFQDQDWTQLFVDAPKKVNEAWQKNAPLLQQQIIKNFKESPIGQLTFPFTTYPKMDPNTGKIIEDGIKAGANQTGEKNLRGSGGYNVPTKIDQTALMKQMEGVHTDIGKKPAIMKLDANTNPFDTKVKHSVNQIPEEVVIRVRAETSQFMAKMKSMQKTAPVGSRFRASQAGYQGTVHRPTMFIAGEGGRPEDVTVRPRGSVQRGGSGGGFNGIVNVYVDGVLRPARYDMGARK